MAPRIVDISGSLGLFKSKPNISTHSTHTRIQIHNRAQKKSGKEAERAMLCAGAKQKTNR